MERDLVGRYVCFGFGAQLVWEREKLVMEVKGKDWGGFRKDAVDETLELEMVGSESFVIFDNQSFAVGHPWPFDTSNVVWSFTL